MIFYTLQDLSEDVDSNLHAGGVSGLQDFFKTVDKARRQIIKRVRPEELIRKSYLESVLYPNVDRYAMPDDMKYKDVIEIGLLSGYRNVDVMAAPLGLVFRRRFDQKRNGSGNVINIGYENGIKYARVFAPNGLTCGPWVLGSNGQEVIEGNQYILINDCDSLSANGTWNIGGNVVNLQLDQLFHVIGFGSLKFDINDSDTNGFIENFTLTPFDLSDMLQRGAAFAWLDIPIPKEMLAVKLTMGSNTGDLTTDLYTSTVNQPHDNNAFITGWNLLKFMLNNLTPIGTPNPKALAYIRFDFTTTGKAIPSCHLDNIVARKGRVYEIVYNSSYILMDALTKAWKKIGTDYSDIIVAEEDTYDVFMWECTLAAQKELFGSAIAAQSDVTDVETQLQEAYARFNMEHPSEALLDTDSAHVFGNQYDGLSDDPLPGYGGDSYGGW